MSFEEYRTANLDELYELGRLRGESVALSNQEDFPELGETKERPDDFTKVEIEDMNDALEYYVLVCHMGEENDRQYTPFEFIASEINRREDRDEAWASYEDGIHQGIEDEFFRLWSMRQR